MLGQYPNQGALGTLYRGETRPPSWAAFDLPIVFHFLNHRLASPIALLPKSIHHSEDREASRWVSVFPSTLHVYQHHPILYRAHSEGASTQYDHQTIVIHAVVYFYHIRMLKTSIIGASWATDRIWTDVRPRSRAKVVSFQLHPSLPDQSLSEANLRCSRYYYQKSILMKQECASVLILTRCTRSLVDQIPEYIPRTKADNENQDFMVFYPCVKRYNIHVQKSLNNLWPSKMEGHLEVLIRGANILVKQPTYYWGLTKMYG